MLPVGDGRTFADRRRVRLGDVTLTGRARLDAMARWVQDAAFDDLRDSGVDEGAVWVLRRATLVVGRRPRFGEALSVLTWVTGTGVAWAERRTTITGDAGGSVEAVGIWVAIDPKTFRPRAMSERFVAAWGPSATRPVRPRLSHPRPPESLERRPLQLRLADYDLAGHVNNAIAWAVLEQAVAANGAERRVAVAAVEYPAPISPDADVGVLAQLGEDEVWCWLTGAGGETFVSAAARLEPGSGAAGDAWPG